MPSIPRYSGATVATTNLPNVRFNAHDTGQQALAQGVANLGGALGQIAQQQRQREDESLLMDFENSLVAERQTMLEDPQTGAVTKRGRDALGLSQQLVPQWDKTTSERLNALPSRLRERAGQLRERHGQQLLSGLARHELAESERFHAESANAGLALAVDEAIANRNNPEARDEAMARGMVYASTEWDRIGAAGEQRELLRRNLVSGMHKRIIDAASLSDPDEAERLLGQWRQRLTAADTLEIEQNLRPIAAERTGRAIADALFQTGTATAPGGNFTGEVTRIKPATTLVDMDAQARRRLTYNDPALDGYAAHVEQQQGLPPGLLNALKNAGEKSNSWQTSPAGAQGVMQFMPTTARAYGLADPEDPVASIDAAGRYMHDLVRQYGGNVEAAVAHYNGGTKAGRAVLEGRAPPAKETRDYLARINAALAPSGQPAPATPRTPGKPLSVAELILQLPPNLPAAERQAAETRIRTLAAARDAQQARADHATGMAIYEKATNLPPTQPLTMALSDAERRFVAENPGVLSQINNYRELLASGTVITDDPTVTDKLFRLRATDPTAFATYPLAQHAHQLSGRTFAAFADDQRQASAPGKAEEWATEAEVLRLAAVDIGLVGDTAARGEFDLAYFREKRAFVAANKREPNADEMQVIVNRLKQPFARRRWWGGEQANRRAYQGPAEGYTVPAVARAQIVAALQDAGIAQPTEQQIVETYLNTGDATL